MKKNATSEAKSPSVQEVCIDLPGETVQCWRSSDKIRVVLRKHRDVFFDIHLQADAIYTVESSGDFYSPREKRLMRKASFFDGERFHIWVGREFKHKLVLKLNGHTLGTYEVASLDSKDYGADPKNKPEPLVVLMGQTGPGTGSTNTSDPQVANAGLLVFKPSIDPKLSMLKEFGSEFDYSVPAGPPEVHEYVAVVLALPDELRLQVRERLDKGEAVEGTAAQPLTMPDRNTTSSSLHAGIAAAIHYVSGNSVLNSNLFKVGAGYIIENFKAMNTLTMKLRIEPKVKGKYRVIIKGRPLDRFAAQMIGARVHAKTTHINAPLGSKSTSFVDGNFVRTGKNGYGNVRRITLTSTSNFRAGMKVQAIGTVIDLIGDANTVFFDEQGSKDLSEFLGRAGVSIVKAGATAAIGSAFASLVLAGVPAIGLAVGFTAMPVIVVVGLVIAGYFAAATLVDLVDNGLQVKERVARAAH